MGIDIALRGETSQPGQINDTPGHSTDNPSTMELELSVCSIRKALEASLLLLDKSALRGGVDIRMDLAPEADERFVADKEKLIQILFSLLANAVRFTGAGGSVDVQAVRVADCIRITVADTGVGIKTEDIPNLFQAFTPQESVYSRECKGSGPGLALTRQLVELHGGELWVESEFGTGSRFSFTIPLRNCAGIT